DVMRYDAVAAPMGWATGIFSECVGEFRIALLKGLAGDGSALRRDPCANARAQRAAVEILVRLLGRCLFDAAFDSHLPFKRLPEEQQARARMGGELLCLARLIIGVEH